MKSSTILFSLILSSPSTLLTTYANRNPHKPGDQNIDDRPTPKPTRAPTPAPTSSPTKVLSTFPSPSYRPCTVDSNGAYGADENDAIEFDVVEIDFHYELQYENQYENQLDSLLSDLEESMGNLIIENTFGECMPNDRRRGRLLRQLREKVKGHDSVVGLSGRPADSFVDDQICKELPQKCKVVKGAFKIFKNKKSSTDEESQVVAEDQIDSVSDEEMKESFRGLISASMSSGSLSSSVPGITRLHYIGQQSISASISTSEEIVKLRDANNAKLYLSITGVILAMVSMVAIGTLMKRNRENRGYAVSDEQTDTVGLTSGSGSGSAENSYNKNWNKTWEKWENVTQTYDNAVEVCMRRVETFRRGSERVDNVRRERNEFVSI